MKSFSLERCWSLTDCTKSDQTRNKLEMKYYVIWSCIRPAVINDRRFRDRCACHHQHPRACLRGLLGWQWRQALAVGEADNSSRPLSSWHESVTPENNRRSAPVTTLLSPLLNHGSLPGDVHPPEPSLPQPPWQVMVTLNFGGVLGRFVMRDKSPKESG